MASAHSPDGCPLTFEVIATERRARATRIMFRNRECLTPMFMPVGTQGTVKGLTSRQLQELECQIVLGNTYHLENRPGSALLRELGGLSEFMSWDGGTLTDSGGFQMVSLLDLADISEEGVTFQSPVDGQQLLLTPERSTQIQNDIGANIMMALDDVALFGIIQGGLDPKLRDVCINGLKARGDKLPGYAIGGLAGGEEKSAFCKVVSQCTAALPPNKPRYVMGVGYPLDLVVCSALGADMYDCVYPSRTARFGTALVPEGVLRLKSSAMAKDYRPIDNECDCLVCKCYTRAHLHAKITKEPHAASLLTYHNIRFQMRLCQDMHRAITSQDFEAFVQAFIRRQFANRDIPAWVREALELAKIDL